MNSAAQPNAALAQALRQAVLGLPWSSVHDRQAAGPLRAFPSLDLAVVAFPTHGAPLAANVLFSREHPQGLVAQFAGGYGAVDNLRFVADVRDAAGTSVAWQPQADGWQIDGSQIDFPPLQGRRGPRLVAPYPASLIKLPLAVGLAWAVDQGLTTWETPQPNAAGQRRPLAEWCGPMLTHSDNAATDVCVATLHRCGLLGGPQPSALHALFARLGLHTLRLAATTAAGGWRNGDGSGVGQLQMTAWDTVRLLWWLDGEAPALPWIGSETPPTLQLSSQNRLRAWLQAQSLNQVLSSSTLRQLPGGMPGGMPGEVPGWMPGIPDDEVDFAHKTGTTDNYAADAGIVRGRAPHSRHYLVALLSTLGRRYAPHEQAAVPWCLPMLGARIDALMKALLEPSPSIKR